jgi:hypothetical protein
MNAPVKQPIADDPKVIALRQPITTHAGSTNKLVMREPTAMDFVEINALPFEIIMQGDQRDIKFNFKVGLQWLSRLTGVGEMELHAMGKTDFLTSLGKVANIVILEGSPDPKN